MVTNDLVLIDDTTDVTERECPICGAQPGECCSSPPNEDELCGTEHYIYVHKARYEAYES